MDESGATLKAKVLDLVGWAEHAMNDEDQDRQLILEALITKLREATPEPKRAKVILFKPSGKYYTEEEWEIPAVVRDMSAARGKFTREAIVPVDMLHSPDFRRIEGGPVLVESQEPWGYPHLFPGVPS